MKQVLILGKKEGETPLSCLESFRIKNKDYKDLPMTYAGRLDPMASGLLVILAGEETKNKEKYLSLDKEYEFEVLFGFATDTYDILGKVEKMNTEIITKQFLEKQIKNNLKSFTGKLVQTYPIYSSKTVKGKPLFQYAREGESVEMPTREVFVKKMKFIKSRKMSANNLLRNIEKRIARVKGDFRQKEIIKIWQKNLKNEGNNFFIGSFSIKCSSGTYVRSIANSLGERLNTPSLAFSIKRTKIGKWSRI